MILSEELGHEIQKRIYSYDDILEVVNLSNAENTHGLDYEYTE